MAEVQVTIGLSADTARRLAVLAGGSATGTDAIVATLYRLIDHAQQGVYRPGAWERDWLMQVFGDEWLSRVEPDTGDVAVDGRIIFDRPCASG